MNFEDTQRELVEEIDREFAAELRREENTVEALLFTMGGSVPMEDIQKALELSKDASQQAVDRLLNRYAQADTGLEIVKVGDNYQMRTRKEYFEPLIRVAKHPEKPVLTDVVMETLAIIAYKQPVTKAEIEKIRGVKSDHAVNKLIEYNLVYEVGRLNQPGRPALFATTEDFLRRFGVSSLDDLPSLNPDIAEEIKEQVDAEVLDVMGPENRENETNKDGLEDDARGDAVDTAESMESIEGTANTENTESTESTESTVNTESNDKT